MCHGGDGDVIIERKKRCGIAILLSAIKTIDSFCPQFLDTDHKTDENPLLLLLLTNVLQLFFHYHLPEESFKTFFSTCPTPQNLIPHIYCISMYDMYIHS